MGSAKRAELPPVPDRGRFPIGEAARLAGAKPHTLRYWEKELPPRARAGRSNGRRYYTRDQVLMLQRLATLLREGATLPGAVRRLQKSRPPPAASPEWIRKELEKVLSIL